MYERPVTADDVDDQPPRPHRTYSTNSGVGRGSGFRGRNCAGCHLPIRERHYLSAVDADWHTTCLVCSACHMSLASQPTCYVKDSLIYCKHDYFRSARNSVDRCICINTRFCHKNVCYPAEFGRFRSNGTSVINEIHLKHLTLASRLPRSLKVGGTDTDRSATYDLLLTFYLVPFPR